MKKSILLFGGMLLFVGNLFAQAPQKMSYQGVVRNADNELVVSETVGVQFSVLQGSADGTAVYVETQSPSTNSNGLISLEVGSGVVVSGELDAIDWSEGPYFISTEIDPDGGTSYSIEGVSELMSVPYALHANVADSIAGGISVTELDPLFEASVASDITEDDIANWNDHVDSTDIADFGFVVGIVTYEVGDFAQGGVVVWVDETKQHGLVCSKNNVAEGMRWFAGTYGTTRSAGDGVFAGELNTSILVSSQIAIGDDGMTYAGAECVELVVVEDGVSYGDWYLPSKKELELIDPNLTLINATAAANGGTALVASPHWTSTEVSGTNVYVVVLSPGGVSSFETNKVAGFTVRAFRSF